jgi:glycine/D-amino acid oxidase-like deaminating enzyme
MLGSGGCDGSDHCGWWGIVGLSAPLLLARDSHQVTVLERDRALTTDPQGRLGVGTAGRESVPPAALFPASLSGADGREGPCELGSGWRNEQLPGPSRDELVALAASKFRLERMIR